jgi:serine/threonine protein kinase
MKKIFDREGKPVDLGPVVGRGGEALVYSMPGNPARIAKIYEPAPHPNYPAKLAWMLNNPPVDPTAALGHPSLAWPAALLYDQEHHLAGYLMPYIKEAAPILVVFNPRRRSETLPQFDRRYLHHTASNLANAIGALHQSNYVVGDLNESNILVKSSALVSLIDIDSFQVQEPNGGRTITYACPVAKPEYTPPELQGKRLSNIVRTSEQDAFGLGVLIFQLLMEGNHPFRAQWLGKGDPPPLEERIAIGGFPYASTLGVPVRPPKHAPDLDWLHPALTELIRRCFIDGHQDPHQRPGAFAWAKAIAEAESNLVQCSHGHVYSGHLPACPTCHAGCVTSRASAPSTTVAHPPGSNAQGARKTTAGKSQTTTATSSRSTASPASASSASPKAGSSAASNTVPPAGTNPRQTSSGQSAANASSANPGQRTSGRPPVGPYVNKGFKQTQHAWKTFRYWQSQSKQTGSTQSGNQVQQVKAAWNAWKYWQAGPIQGPGPNPPPFSGPAKGQPSPRNSAPAQNNKTTTNAAGAGSMNQAPRPSANPSRAQQTGPAPFYTSPPQPSRNTSSSTGAPPGMPATSILNWAGPRLYKSLAIGGGLGALVGALSGALLGVTGWLAAGSMTSWLWLWAVGGASAGLLRGWLPGYRVSLWVDRSVGWQRVLPVVGVLIGASLGGLMGFAVCWWAILPVFIGLFFGGRMGLKAGSKLWLFGAQYGWDRIWACLVAFCTGLLGLRLALWLGAGSLSTQLAGSFFTWITGQSVDLVLIALAFGALGGALGGVVAGTLADLFARLFNLLD